MMKQFFLIPLILFACLRLSAQIPTTTHIQILKAEDARRYDKTLEDLLKSQNEQIRIRSALAAGRIGNDAAIPALSSMLEKGLAKEREMAAFALGEIESIKAADVILRALGIDSSPAGSGPPQLSESSRVLTRVAGNGNGVAETRAVARMPSITSRVLEAAGKIAAANPNDSKSKELGAAIVKVLTDELTGPEPKTEVVRLGLTAVLRARPTGADETVRKFLAFTDPNIVADALNTLARLRAKNANRDARDLLASHLHAIVRANAARVLGAAEDKVAVDVLIKAATSDPDSRVRVSSIRALGAIKDPKSAEPLLARGEALLDAYKKNLRPNFIPVEQNEFIEISNALGQVLAKTGNARAIALFREFARVDQFKTAEPYIARVKVGGIKPGAGMGDGVPPPTTWQQYSTLARVFGELAAYEPESDEAKKIKDEAPDQLRKLLATFLDVDAASLPAAVMATPDVLQAFARFKTTDLAEIARKALLNKDVQIRAAAAGILADLPTSKENVEALNRAFANSLLTHKESDDAQLAILDALYKVDKKEVAGWLLLTLKSGPDYLVRKKAFELLEDKDIQAALPGVSPSLKKARESRKDQVLPYSPDSGTKLGQVLNTDGDYRRAALRRSGTVKAVLTTEKGTFTIDLLPEDAPLTVDNFIKLARTNYFNGLEVHRVVPNFVMQDGDPRGDGNGGPGWSIRCEVNMVPYERGAVGMALSGKDTGGSQWFVTHSPQPHLDGGYTVFGKVNETGMKVVDNIVRGDKILSIRIIGN